MFKFCRLIEDFWPPWESRRGERAASSIENLSPMKQKGEIWYFTCHMCDITGVLRSVSFSPEKRSQLNQVVDSPIKTCKVSTFAIQKHNSRVQEVYKSTGNQADKEETNFDVLPLTYFSIIVCLSTNKNWNKLCTHILWTYN